MRAADGTVVETTETLGEVNDLRFTSDAPLWVAGSVLGRRASRCASRTIRRSCCARSVAVRIDATGTLAVVGRSDAWLLAYACAP
ncbi:MAG: hypothetical protein OHK0013_25110 [Sandaracinaceae bacterium]